MIPAPSKLHRLCFTEGIPLDLRPPPPSYTNGSMRNGSSCVVDHASLGLRWRVGAQARPTTWIELFALFRIMGGGPRNFDPLAPRLTLMPAIRDFVKASKALFKITAGGEALAMLRADKSKGFKLADYGLEAHAPAIVSEICLDAGMADKLHNMMLKLRIIKQGINKDKLRASSAPLPKKEPWVSLLALAPTPIIDILSSREARRLDNISMRGETGDGRELQPLKFPLVCPTCGTSKECAKVRLFTNVAKGLTCSTCRKSTTSTRWSCFHGTPWTDCPVCRQVGFRCGSQSLRTHRNKSGCNHVSGFVGFGRNMSALHAAKKRQARLKSIGTLGEPKRSPQPRDNSGCASTTRRTLVRKKKSKEAGESPNPKVG